MLVVGAFLLTRGLILPAGILFAISALRFGGQWTNPARRTHGVIRTDAAKNGLRLPDDPMVLSQLEAVYAKYWQASERFPSLATQYDDVMISMWQELKLAANVNEWRRIIHRVTAGWVAPWGNDQRPVEESLSRLRNASTMWREAEAEAFGPSPRPT